MDELGKGVLAKAYSKDGECLNVSGIRHVRSTAQIDEGTTSVDGRLGALGHALVDEILLVLAVLEHLKQFVLGHLETNKRLLLFNDGVGDGLEGLLVLLSNGLTIETELISGKRTVRDLFGQFDLRLTTKKRVGVRTRPCSPCRSKSPGDPW